MSLPTYFQYQNLISFFYIKGNVLNISSEIIFTSMLQALISKYGVMLTSKDCAEALGISTRTLDERRKLATDCPEFIEAKKGIMFPVQNVVKYQLEKTKQCIKVNY